MGRLPNIKLVLWLLLLIIVVSGTAAAAYYHITTLEPEGRSYIEKLSSSANRLKRSFADLARESDKTLLEKQYTTAAEAQAGIDHLDTLLAKTRIEINEFKAVSGELRHLPYAFTSGTYRKSIVLKNQSSGTTEQAQEVLDEYAGLLAFLHEYYPAQMYLHDELAAFNALSDLNTLASSSEKLRGISRVLRDQGDRLVALTLPQGMEKLARSFLATNKRAANGFEALAAGLSPPIDDKIYAAARELEVASHENELIHDELLDVSLEKSPILIHVSELPDKIERFKF